MRIHVISLAPMSKSQKQRLSALGDLVYHDAVLGDSNMGELCRGAEILLITPRIPVNIVPFLDCCRFISVQATGVDALDLAALRRKRITVSNIPGAATGAVAEHAVALLLGAAKKILQGPPLLREGRWTSALAYETTGLHGKTLGLFGCGKIGGRIAAIARGFGMHPIATVRNPATPRDVPTVPLSALLSGSDFLVLAAPATPETRRVFGREAFQRMKRTAILVNISRAALVDTAELLEALDQGWLAAAATDVFDPEPPEPGDPLLHHPKVLISPHVAWGASETVENVLDRSIENVEAFLQGNPINVVT